ncbi:MAG: hypothetical protein LBF91_06515 [Azoarcus sp.]|nr:hypothetical protein [Azoarcus sp.]
MGIPDVIKPFLGDGQWISFQNNAKRHGANAVVDMVSFYDRKEYGDPEKFECHAGAIMAGVVMKGKAAIVE